MSEISVIIPTYQHAHTIAACLESVLNQTFKDIEIIVIDDGSTDQTVRALEPFRHKIKYERIAHAGAPIARNTGFRLSRGAYVIFCDADVVMAPHMLQKLHDALTEHTQTAFAYTGFKFGWKKFSALSFDADRLKESNFIHTTSLIRRNTFPGFDEGLNKFQDWDLWLTMLRQGSHGIAVQKILFSVEPRRDGMSYWMPKIAYWPLWEALGIVPRAVQRYRDATAVIREKHNLQTTEPRHMQRLWTAFLIVLAVSAVAYRFPLLGTIVCVLILVGTICASLNRLIFGVAIMLAELILGSLGGATLALNIGNTVLPLRIALFLAVGAIWLIRILQGRLRKPPIMLSVGIVSVLIMVGWGIMNGINHGIPWNDVFFDSNAYFALPTILFFISAVEQKSDQRLLRSVLQNGLFALTIITVLILYFFSHIFPNNLSVFIYKWLRDTRIAEITALTGGVYRVFLQSQIFAIFGLLIALLHTRGTQLKTWRWGIVSLITLIISLSRSFILGLIVAMLTVFIMSVTSKRIIDAFRVYRRLAVLLITGTIFFLLVLRFPLPTSRSQESFQEILLSRSISGRDAATASRWSLLPKLNEKIRNAPILGNGFGTSVTYQSSDPRIISTTGGAYTTSAFEWGYHDIVVKLGLFGLLAYGFLLIAILKGLLRAEEDRLYLIPAFFALLATNIVSPYLNHPLGIGYLALLYALAQTKKAGEIPVRVMVPVRSPNISVSTT